MHDPREPHLAALKRILRYVWGTLHLSLLLRPSTLTDLVVYTDTDWAGCPDTRRSTSGYAMFLGNNLVSWSSKRQNTVSRSSAEAEYHAVSTKYGQQSIEGNAHDGDLSVDKCARHEPDGNRTQDTRFI
jgi:hypothetical protein